MSGNYFFKKTIIFLVEFVVVFLMVFGILPREAALFLTGLLVFYFIFSPIEDSLWIFIASIPLFIALPITENFDSMASWRILLLVLFLVWVKEVIAANLISIFKKSSRGQSNIARYWKGLSMNFFFRNDGLSRLVILTIIFLAVAVLSLTNASDVIVGFKKVLYLINIFMIFFVVRGVIRNRADFLKIIQAIGVAIGLVLVVGYVQLSSIFFVFLHIFWQYWAKNIISVFYGGQLSNLLSYSNTWFSYYANQPPTLRMFSVFPDSHSFAIFIIIGLPFLLTAIFLRNKKNKKQLFALYPILIIALLALIFSGSRGIWVSAIGALIVFLLIILLSRSPTIRLKTGFFTINSEQGKVIQLIFGSLIIFFFLFPISSGVLLLSQKAQAIDPLDVEKVSLFERAKSVTDFSEISAKSRLDIWRKTVSSIAIQPILGVGIGNYPLILGEDISAAKRGASAHNLYLDVASEMGIFALLVLLAIFWEIMISAWRVFQENKELLIKYWAGFFILAFVWILSYSLFDVVLLNDKALLFFTVSLGILFSTYASKPTISFG